MIKKKCFLLILLFLVIAMGINAQTWIQIGADIDGEAANDRSGDAVSLSADGSVVAIGAVWNSENGTKSGHVRVYKNIAGVWTQIGEDIDGDSSYDYFGASVSLNSDGSVLAVGSNYYSGISTYAGLVRIYQNVAGTWTQIGTDINGETMYSQLGNSVSLSSDGSIVAIGARFNSGNGAEAGHVRVYKNISGTWTQIGADIDGESVQDWSGYSVSLSSDGSTVAIGAILNDGNGSSAGHVRIYQNVAGTWTQIGDDIDGEAANDESGYSVSLNSDGTVVAIGAQDNDGNGSNAGHVRIYKNLAGIWTQLGNDIDGEAAGDKSGNSVSLSSDGSTVAVGAYMNNGGGSENGHVRIYKYITGTWTQIGADINGEYLVNHSGSSVSIDTSGTIVAIGAPLNDGNGTDAGHVRVYNLLILPIITSQPVSQTNICPGSEVVFSVQGVNIETLLWQVSTNSGNNWTDLYNDITYSGTSTDSLTIIADTILNNYQYRCYLTSIDGYETSNAATLSLDSENPVITSIHDDQYLNSIIDCDTVLPDYIDLVIATDNCDTNLTVTQSPVSGTTVTGETNQVTLTVTDDAGNEAKVSFNVKVLDSTNPVITSTHNNQYLGDGIICDTVLPDYTGLVLATDNCDDDLTVTQLPVSGTTISGLTNQITLTVTDNDGNEAEINFNVEVIDSTNPMITCRANQEVNADATNTYIVSGIEFDPVSTDDNCAIESLVNDFNSSATLAGESLPAGITNVVWTVTDLAGNISTCSCIVTVNQATGLSNINETGISIYPNPTNDIVEIDFADKNIYKITLIDISGKKIIEKRLVKRKEKLDLSSFENGLYIILFETDKEIYTSKIIKE